MALQRFDFLQWFEGIVVSGIEKVVKPRREIFEILLSRYSVDRSRAVFIDDHPNNVEGAKDAGIHGIQFTSPDKLRQDLRRLGIETTSLQG